MAKCYSKCYSEYFNIVFHQIRIREIVQFNSNKHGFQKHPFINVLQNRCSEKLCRIHMKAREICNSNKKRFQCRCFPENFSKFLIEAAVQKCSVKKVFCLLLPDPCNFIKKDTLAHVFSCKSYKISKNTFF